MLKNTVITSLCAFLLIGSVALAQSPATITMQKHATASTESHGVSKMTITYPIVSITDNETAEQKISVYFSDNAQRSIKNFRSHEDKYTTRSAEINYKVKLNDGKYLSFIKHYFIYFWRAAHPLSADTGVTFDAQTGKTLRWENLIRPEDAKAFTLQAINEKLFASTYGQKHYFYNSFKGLKKLPNNYYLDNNHNIHFIFGQYEIAPYAVGIIDLNMEKQAK